MRNIAGKALIIVALGAGASGLAVQQAHADTIYKTPIGNAQTLELRVECEEDEPCWDCRTMGNKICGPDMNLLHRWEYGPGAFVGTGSAGPLRKG